MKRKFFACLLSLVLALGLMPQANAAAEPDQVEYAGGSVLYNAAGQTVDGTELGQNDSVVKISKTIAQYVENGAAVENEFVVTLEVQTSQNIREIASDTPDSAVLLVMDVSNSMDDCIRCGNEANHSDHRGTSTTTYYCDEEGGNTFSSRGNSRYCRHCRRVRSQHNAVTTTVEGECAYQSRLDATKTAAKDFLYEFANETGAQTGDRRMVAIVSYGTHAVTAQNWVDITTTEGMYAAETAIDGLTIANGNHDRDLQGGGTSIESGLALGRNLLGQEDIDNIDYRYTILLTDGQPTYPSAEPNNERTSYISGSTSTGGSTTEKSDMDHVAGIADAIIDDHKSKLYSICFGTVDDESVWDLTPFGDWDGENPDWRTTDETTIGEWLGSFSTAAYEAEDASTAKLFDSFSSILAQIQVAARAWKVEDWMGPYMVYAGPVNDADGNNVNEHPNAEDYPEGEAPAFVWDLLTSDPDLSNWDSQTNTGVLSYTHQYRVTLDNLDTRYSTTDGNEKNPSNDETNANTLATLRYATTDENGNWPESTAGYKTATFPVPQVRGLVGELVFRKVDDGNPAKPIEGVVFRLRSKDYTSDPSIANQWAYVDAVSNDKGIVTFTGIPSGHEYTLLESEKPDHYEDLGDLDVSISWADATISKGTNKITDTDEEGYITLVNKVNETELGKLTIKKKFAAGSEIPASIQFEINGPDGYTAHRELNIADDQGDGVWTWTMTGLHFGEYTIQEINAVDEHGNLLRGTHDLEYSIMVDGVEKVQTTQFNGDNEPKIEVEIKADSPEKTVEVQFVNNMTPKEGELTITKSFVGLPTNMVNANMGLTMQVTATPVDANGAAIDGKQSVTMDLVWNGTAYAASKQLPIGRYLLTENITGTVSGYSLLHYVFEQNGANIEDGIVTVTDSTNLAVTLKNHYERDHGRIYINKSFDGDLDEEHFEGRVIYVNIRENDKDGDVVAKLVLDEGDGQWTAESPLLPVGTYYLEEVVAENAEGTAFEDGYVHDVTWAPSETVDLTRNALVSIGLTNSYTEQGVIQITKSFAADSDLDGDYFIDNQKAITIEIRDSENKTVDTLTLPDSNGQWIATSKALTAGTYTLVESGAEVDGYILGQTWTNIVPDAANSVNVTVTDGEISDVSLTNKYTQKEGYLKVTKIFEGLPDNVREDTLIAILVKDESGETVANLKLYEGHWSETVKLPVGFYTLEETGADIDEYVLTTPSWTGLTDNKIEVKEEHTEELAAQVSVTNTYTAEFGYLTIVKKLSGLESPDSQFSFDIKDANGTTVQRVPVEVAGSEGSRTIKLPLGQYTVEEVPLPQREDSRYEVSWSPVNPLNPANALVTISANQTEAVTVTCTNTNVPKATVKIPVQKTVKVNGNTLPGETTFTFGAEWSNPANVDLDVSFQDASGNTAGYVKQTAANAYTITVDGEGTVKGYIVISGYASELEGFQLTTWEKLNPYSSVQAAKDAYWNYDQTAQGDTLRWKVTLKANGHSMGYDIALGATGGKEAIAFENTYEKVEVPQLPETGDNDMPLLYLLLIAVSASGIMLLRKKYTK